MGLSESALARLGRLDPERLRALASVSWERPAEGRAYYGFGRALVLRGNRASPFVDATEGLREIARGAISFNVEEEARPRFFGGGRFVPGGQARDTSWDVFGGWQFVIPSLLVAIVDDEATASLTYPGVPGEEDPARAAQRVLAEAAQRSPAEPLGRAGGTDDADWQRMIGAALDEEAEGRYEKVVLARSVDARFATPPRLDAVLGDLAARYPACSVFSFRAGGATWMGASPEMLCRVREGSVFAACLAGSRKRGQTSREDECLATELLTSPKEQEEHRLVVEAIEAALDPITHGLCIPDEPRLVRLANIQHLFTPAEGRLIPGVDVLEAAARLHPTPAVGGLPRPAALDAIRRLEGMDRGWYAGPIGWVDMQGEGEFAVALRTALVSGDEARLYAGAGIVPGSEPSRELAETETKLIPLRTALGVA